MAIYMQPDYKSLLRWLPVYLMGAVGGYYWDDHILGRIFRNKHDCFFTLGALLSFLIFYGYSLYKNSDIYIIYTSPILIWIVVDGLFYRLIQRMRVKKWMSYMFFIFCTHHFVLNVLQKIVVIYCEPTRFVVYLTYLLSPVICVLLLIKVAGVLSRYRFYKILTGGR